MNHSATKNNQTTGDFVTFKGERYYAIYNVDSMDPFFISLISDSDHWLFVSSTGGLTAGRVSPETSLFPYCPVDKVNESWPHTGSKTLLKVGINGQGWEPFNTEHDGYYQISRNLYKNTLGNKICFEEINHDLNLVFRYSWLTSDEFGFVRQSEVENLGDSPIAIKIVDGLQNILPAGTPRFTQTASSNLVDAYKWTELHEKSGVAMFTLYSGITDRAEPCESLRANTLFSLGLENKKILLSSEQLSNFRKGQPVVSESTKRGIRGAYFVNAEFTLEADSRKEWQLIANIEQNQIQTLALIEKAHDPVSLVSSIQTSIDTGSDVLARIMAAADGFQVTNEESVYIHHYANVMFNTLRGGIFEHQYVVSIADFNKTLKHFNKTLFTKHEVVLSELPENMSMQNLTQFISKINDPQLDRLVLEYLPITFGRRHGDPSRPWNQFAIKLKDENGGPLLTYQGNWRDIFQNWEALTVSYPGYIDNVIAKFVNASTMDGYNPYRITKEGIDWEVEEADDPWSYIGYWGDHQIIYLLKLLEWSQKFNPSKLNSLLHSKTFSYANVPYRLKPFNEMLANSKSTVTFDQELAERIEHRLETIGADGKLVLDLQNNGQVYQVNLLEKLILPLLTKLSNLVVDGGIWLNTQRPEWNDANNALVGQGLSMVTLYYMRRYIAFMQTVLANEQSSFELSTEIADWLSTTTSTYSVMNPANHPHGYSDLHRSQYLADLGQSASDYRSKVYRQEGFSGQTNYDISAVQELFEDALAVIDHCIANNLAEDKLYHAYNLLNLDSIEEEKVSVDNLYPMLEGQVAVLSSGALQPAQAVRVINALFDSAIYRQDQKTFMLYPDREQTRFLNKNILPSAQVESIALLTSMLNKGDKRIIDMDSSGTYRFNPSLTNVGDLMEKLAAVAPVYPGIEEAKKPLAELYEEVFNHQAFTGRSGGMFGFEGLGSIYWHMVSKLLFAVMENFFIAAQGDSDEQVVNELAEQYYRIREGIGFNKSPSEYGAFPCDPYSHTPKHAGAQQPGMTGQVKEEILTRFGELGIKVDSGRARFEPALLRAKEFAADIQLFKYLDVAENWQQIDVPANGIAFSWCQVPIVYQLGDKPQLTIKLRNGSIETSSELALSAAHSQELFDRSGQIKLIEIVLSKDMLCSVD